MCISYVWYGLIDIYVLKSILTVNNKLFFIAVEGGRCDALWQ